MLMQLVGIQNVDIDKDNVHGKTLFFLCQEEQKSMTGYQTFRFYLDEDKLKKVNMNADLSLNDLKVGEVYKCSSHRQYKQDILDFIAK